MARAVRDPGFPAMPMYVADWLTGEATTAMTPEQEGAFFRLLCVAWRNDPPCTLPDDDAVLASLSRLGRRWPRVGALVRQQFLPVPEHPGRIRNPKSWEVYTELLERRGRRQRAGALGNAVRWGTGGNGDDGPGGGVEQEGQQPAAAAARPVRGPVLVENGKLTTAGRAEVASVVRGELWRGNKPPEYAGPRHGMANEMNIAERLAKHEPLEDVLGAARLMRRVGGYGDDEPMSLLMFNSRNPHGRRLYNECLSEYRKSMPAPARPRQVG